ncbi:MAG: 3-keto-5-aminohexanoate cleavage protein [Actinobacteria bacterium]|nr:3-keto-5-aminohexanoate cleavage protein [Actinomycetota bacterium]
MTTIDWDRVRKGVERERQKMIWRPYGLPTILDLENTAYHDAPISEAWDLPDRLAVSVTITGAFFQKSQNPGQPVTTQEILDAARSVVEAGASTVHIHVRDDNGYNTLSLERFAQVIEPLHAEYPDLVVDGCLVPALDGEWDEMRRVLDSGLLDAAPVNSTATYIGDSLFVKPTPILLEKTRLIVESGAKPEIAVYTDADVSNADRYLLRSGLVAPGAVWVILPALPGCSPMDNPRQMVEGLTRNIGLIRDVDPNGIILVSAAGRASMHLATLAATLGVHVRVGMEDTYFKWPHREDRLESNAEALRLAHSIADALGRPIATPAEYRQLLGLGVRQVQTA